MKTEQTQEKWAICLHASPHYAPHYGVYVEGSRNDHAVVMGDNAKANAKLIAAAPALLAALQGLLEVTDAYLDTTSLFQADILETIQQAKEAIQQATA